MPLIQKSSYPGPPWYQFNGHLQTIIPGLYRKVEGITYERERIELWDGDFLDLDWIDNKNQNLAILSHGLEGNSDRQYIRGAAKYFSSRNWDVLAWNCRSCSGEMNRKMRLYNHGDIEDIGAVIDYVLKVKNYARIALVGFSMGGSMVLKYLGTHGKDVPENIVAGVAFSTPCDLGASVLALEKKSNWLYRTRFYNSLRAKLEIKAGDYPEVLDAANFKRVKVWKDFDTYFSAPINGYQDADDFYKQASAKNFMSGTRVPTLLVNAQNDPILTPECSPKEICITHPHLYLETPKNGGHVGFQVSGQKHSWSEERAFNFISNFN